MPMFTLKFSPQGWPDLESRIQSQDPDLVVLMGPEAPSLNLLVLEAGMTSGKPSVTFRLELPDGKTVLFETSARIFCTAANAIQARYPDLFVDNDNASHETQTSH